jgi:hypothetical protein
VKRERVLMIFHFLGERVGQASELPHGHPHCEILAFNIGGGNVLHFRIA